MAKATTTYIVAGQPSETHIPLFKVQGAAKLAAARVELDEARRIAIAACGREAVTRLELAADFFATARQCFDAAAVAAPEPRPQGGQP